MRARIAVGSSGVEVEMREILLKDKPPEFLEASASATVPALQFDDHAIDESLDIMIWALEQNDPEGLLRMPDAGWELISDNDGPFKLALDHTKYASRYPDLDKETERAKAADFLKQLDTRLEGHPWLFGAHATIADYAVLPFVRQFANSDRDWFAAQAWPNLDAWLNRFTESEMFARVMTKLPLWREIRSD
jgi:glutathione S-transferase